MRKILLTLVNTLLLCGCSKLHPYYVDVQQGNVIEQSAVTQLHVGLDKHKVVSILGKPLLANMVNSNTWTYVYTNQINGGKIEKKRLILEFSKDKLIKISS